MIRHTTRRAALLGAAAGLSACAMPVRQPAVPRGDTFRASVLGIPNERFVGAGIAAGMTAESNAAIARRRRHLGLPDSAELPMDLLAISGGGENGAFGAGLITAWADRPEFFLVTGVSTGALSAPFAFIGPAGDAGLRRVYNDVTLADILVQRSLLAAVFDDALVDTSPLFRTISRELDDAMLAAIAQGYREGRLLLVGTTNLDAQTPVIWNIGAIAASGHPRAPETIRRVLLASAAIPGAFPPVLFDVEVDGQRFQELHVDGGAVAQAFLYPTAVAQRRRDAIRAGRRVPPVRAWLVRNARMDADWASTERRTYSIAGRAVQTMIAASGYNDSVRTWLNAERDGVEFRMSWIGEGFTVPYERPFDPAYMRPLFAYGQQRMREGTAWVRQPPFT
ncbi:patatin-like phospholipase family protein [Roseococcus sp. DSY-14]|uniref:patatin-like phospholipase family protein n=1 Tax=Roseococcus sp. DSY-14 TaxID=3369650 RepID=UPI00387B07CD